MEKIQHVEVGDDVRTMMSAALANAVIDGVNAVIGTKILPTNIARVDVGDKVTITFKTVNLIACDDDGNQSTYVLVGYKLGAAEVV